MSKSEKIKKSLEQTASDYPKYKLAADFFEAVEEVLARYDLAAGGLSISVQNNEIRISYYIDDKIEEVVAHVNNALR